MGKHGTLASQALARIGKDWSKSSLTREKLLSNTREFARHVAKNYGLERIDNLKPLHVQSYVNSLHDRGLAPATMADKMTAVRIIAAAIGKQNIVQRTNAAYARERDSEGATKEAIMSELGHGEDRSPSAYLGK